MRRKETLFLTTLAVGLAVLMSPLFYANYQRVRLILWGHPTTATIVRLHDTGHRYREHPELEMTVELEGEPGDSYWVTVQRAVPSSQRDRYVVGAELDVQVDPADPTVVGITGVHELPPEVQTDPQQAPLVARPAGDAPRAAQASRTNVRRRASRRRRKSVLRRRRHRVTAFEMPLDRVALEKAGQIRPMRGPSQLPV